MYHSPPQLYRSAGAAEAALEKATEAKDDNAIAEAQKALETAMAFDVDNFHSYDDEAPVQPDEDGYYPVPVPGKTRTV